MQYIRENVLSTEQEQSEEEGRAETVAPDDADSFDEAAAGRAGLWLLRERLPQARRTQVMRRKGKGRGERNEKVASNSQWQQAMGVVAE
eukprot:871933-Pleurochrysis_carterae.AAC.1